MLKKHKKTIKREFFVTGLVSTLIIAVIFIVLVSASVYYLSLEIAQEKLKSTNLHLTTYTEGVLESLVMSTRINGASPKVSSFKKGDLESEKQILEMFYATTRSNPNIKFCYAGYEDGSLVINDYTPPEGYDPRVRPWYTSAVSKYPEFSVGLPYQDINSKEWLISVSVAMVDLDGELSGVMAVDCTLEYVIALMAEQMNYTSQSNYVVDSDGMVFVHQNPIFRNTKIDSVVPGMSQLFTEDEGIIRYELNGSTRMAYYHKMAISDWIVISAIDASEIVDPIVIRISEIVASLIVLAVLLGMAQVKVYENSFVKPITSLRDRIGEITTGKAISDVNNQYSNMELAEISQRIEAMAEGALRKKNDELRLILDATSDGILVLDLSGRKIHSNDKFNEIWEILRQTHNSENQHRENLDSLKETLENIWVENGTVIEKYSCPLMEQGVVRGRLWRYRDITEKVKAEEDLKRLATTDSLTGLWNRRYFLDKGAHEIDLLKRTGLPLTLLFIDIDYFKHINDTYGHGVGDEALKHTAETLKKHVRSTDIVARIGGEEFCILTPNTNKDSGRLLAEKLRGYFEETSFKVHGHDLHYTISVGVASYESNDNNINELLAMADQACYQAKGQGRNCVVVSE